MWFVRAYFRINDPVNWYGIVISRRDLYMERLGLKPYHSSECSVLYNTSIKQFRFVIVLQFFFFFFDSVCSFFTKTCFILSDSNSIFSCSTSKHSEFPSNGSILDFCSFSTFQQLPLGIGKHFWLEYLRLILFTFFTYYLKRCGFFTRWYFMWTVFLDSPQFF